MRKDPSYLSRMQMDVLDAHDRAIDPASVDWSGAHTPNFTDRRGSRLLQPGGIWRGERKLQLASIKG
jgi:murein L,D-transpeptidase YcbB/YkuD